ncbi:MAG TPA: TonB family protein [Steroidobacteraceae bacterium]|nr:TonB family protein [Steroidobacteraceae bacterium]
MATNPQVKPSKSGVPSGTAPGTYALGSAPLLALTQDEKFVAMLRKVTEPAHKVHVSGSEIDFAQSLMTLHGAVAVLDSAAVATPIEELSGRLNAQFPELVLVVAGDAEEQGRLAGRIADGSVHRFLHKPVSEQRVRLFVDSAWRRHAEGASVTRAAAASGPPGRRVPRALVAAAILGVAAPVAWLATRTTGSDAPATHRPAAAASTAATANDAALEELLVRADKALADGALVAPPAENAAGLYREALKHSPNDPRALAGLEQVIDRLVTDAEAQLAQHRLEAAQQLADAARAINPDHPRVAFLTAQIGAQRERAVLGKAQRAAAGGDMNAALAVLDDATRGGHRSSLVDEARQQFAQKQVDERVADFVARARAALASGALLEPAEDNAYFYLESARALAPQDPAVQQLRTDLNTRLEAEARQAVTAGNADAADRWTSAAAESGADPGDVAALRAAAEQLRGVAQANALARLEGLFNQRLAQGRLVEPANDSARYYLEQLAQSQPAGASTIAARTAYESRLLEEVHNAARAQDLPAARRWLAEAQAAGVNPEQLASAQAEIGAGAPRAAAPAAAPAAATPAPAAPAPTPAAAAPTYVDASTLKRTRTVNPDYPPQARERGIEGWVDLQFVVNTDGTVGEAQVVGAQPADVFEQSALEAVRRWRFQPVVREGAAVPQKARVRLRFTVQQ